MADRPRFGPAGRPIGFKGKTFEVPKYLRDEGLDAFEFQAVRWGDKPQISMFDAEKLKSEAEKNDVWLSMHASYFINFCGDEKTIKSSIARLLACVKAAKWMHAHIVVFHPGFYKGKSKKEALETCIKSLWRVEDAMKSLNIKNVYLGPETTGKQTQLGSVEEIIKICEEVDIAKPVVDWAHIHARNGDGCLKGKEDYIRVLNLIEEHLGGDTVKNLHIHYTRVEFTRKGERKHHTMDEKEYGPDFKPFAELIAEFDLKPVIISESPILDLDSIKMKEIVMSEIKKRTKIS